MILLIVICLLATATMTKRLYILLALLTLVSACVSRRAAEQIDQQELTAAANKASDFH